MTIEYTTDLTGLDYAALKADLIADDFDNGRTLEQYRISFANSALVVLAYAGEEGRRRCVGNVRVLSDGVCNAYIVDVWTHSTYRNQGVARHMMELAMAQLPGQHVYLFTDSAHPFYEKLGFAPQGVGLGAVVGRWLENEP
jgi:GNAT superfamily N-acetyltransferase